MALDNSGNANEIKRKQTDQELSVYLTVPAKVLVPAWSDWLKPGKNLTGVASMGMSVGSICAGNI